MAKKIDAWWSDIGLIAHAVVQCDVLSGREFEESSRLTLNGGLEIGPRRHRYGLTGLRR